MKGQYEDIQSGKYPDPNVISTKAISCSDVLGAIGLIYSGSYAAYAATDALLGISGGLSAGIPFIIATVYYLASLLC
ncbi:hypothetical protein P4S93_17425 [Aneurinibacillus thermoaerophilus]|uniref:hypothetical protein n=1 Tax=Aneurinibacillus TaxID=55079 RepID=UPI000B312389|nr:MULTISPECIES: hypothetical protein [Aneurinibacillus]MED0677607.1 hypothetical protein [Aneurinibacillus thermoaerophilus]MED0679228.1 hypothetical protein [Aneurinibacillus thermoaerophilus]MED0757160.1 hypothetical protein [Aneurinibacillus thermoaerophilus]MED0762516.1 hypothetical protein [Aneurinibacillus thermoaerophilus]MED0764833.1 hypothetical protein [Aneurinibacillus thermoaerophilus]